MRTDWQAQIETMLDEYGRLRDRLASLRGALASLTTTITSADGTVTATVGPQGRLVGLILDPSSTPYADRLADRIVATVAEASARADGRVQEVVAEFMPPGLRGMVPDDLAGSMVVVPSGLPPWERPR
jgi:DNA-binding protein YbaB